MLLTIDIGNTNTEIGLWKGSGLPKLYKFPTAKRNPAKGYEAALTPLKFSAAEIEKIVIASVVPEVDRQIERYLQKRFVKPVFICPSLINLKVKYNRPADVGADRIAGAYAAGRLYGPGSFIIIDFGTAITFDIVTRKKEYLGGVIVPGIITSKQALVNKASLLSDFKLKKPVKVIGNSTQKSMNSGIYYGTVCLVRGLLKEIKKQLKGGNIKVIATGGDAGFIAKEIKEIEIIEPHLVHLGLKFISEELK